MEKFKLSEIYAIATKRMGEAVAELYEDLHDDEGNPISKREKVSEKATKLKKNVLLEIDLIKQAALESQNK